MLKTGILHPQLVRVLAGLRHRGAIIIGGAGLPIPKGAERVNLSWRSGDPVCLDALEEILRYITMRGVVFADEMLTATPDFHKKALELLPQELLAEYVPHTEFKERSEDTKAIVLTGESTGCTNVILVAGCTY